MIIKTKKPFPQLIIISKKSHLSVISTKPDRTKNTSPTQGKHNLNNTHAAA